MKVIEVKVRENLNLQDAGKTEPSPENENPGPGMKEIIETLQTNEDINNNITDEVLNEEDETITEMKDNFLRNWELLKEEEMSERLAHPKIKMDIRKTKKNIRRAN